MKNTKILDDRISDLPDELLIHILSFLKTKEAVQTCVLSQRWRNLWTFVPSLYFDFDDFLPDDLDFDDDDLKEYEIKFEKFVSAALRNRGTSILDSFKLSYNNRYGKSDTFTEWILYSLNCKPRELVFDVNRYKERDLPDLLLVCKSLEKMNLSLHFLYNYKDLKTINLPSLKTLELSASIIDDCVMNKFMSGCPVLEELTLRWCYAGTHIISSNQLKHLFIDDFLSRGARGDIQISIPSLTSLVIHFSRGRILLKNMSSLVKARLVLSYDANIDANHKILNGLSNATNLEFVFIGQGSMVILEKELSNCPTFKNLKSLHFDGYVINNFDLIALFLQHAPNLEKLTLTHCENWFFFMANNQICIWDEPKPSSVPSFKNLKSLHFDGHVINNFDLISLFLQNAPNLEKLTLTHCELPPSDAYRNNTSKTERRVSQCEYIPLVDIIYKEDHERVDQLVKTLHTYVKSIGKLNMHINTTT